MKKKTYTREFLIEICEKAIVHHSKWRNRDTFSSQCGLGKAWALLKAGCDFKVMNDKKNPPVTDDCTIWIEIYATGFDYFEGGGIEEETFYLPTLSRLKKENGNDWY